LLRLMMRVPWIVYQSGGQQQPPPHDAQPGPIGESPHAPLSINVGSFVIGVGDADGAGPGIVAGAATGAAPCAAAGAAAGGTTPFWATAGTLATRPIQAMTAIVGNNAIFTRRSSLPNHPCHGTGAPWSWMITRTHNRKIGQHRPLQQE